MLLTLYGSFSCFCNRFVTGSLCEYSISSNETDVIYWVDSQSNLKKKLNAHANTE